MVAGIPPVRAKKARYYEDSRFKERLLPVPDNPNAGFPPKPDDWSPLKPIAASAAATNASAGLPVAPTGTGSAKAAAVKQDDDPANAGLRREPGLEEHKDIAPEPSKKPANEFDPDQDQPQDDAATNRDFARNMRQMARRIAMDPGDGMEI